jgi:ribosomal-protein-alanine N-acetyltransferase
METERLTLVPFTVEVIDAVGHNNLAEQLVGTAIPEGWPDAELAGFLTLYADWLHADASVVGYGPWIVVAREERVVVGSAGFLGKPKEDGSIEIGFGVHPDFRNRGYACEAARALVKWGLDQPGVQRVVAKCDAENLASIRVLEKIGMTRVGSAGGDLLWELAKAER